MRRLNRSLRWRWRRWRGLNPSERRTFISALCMFPTVTLAMRAFGFGRVYAWLGRGAVAAAGVEASELAGTSTVASTGSATVAEMVQLAARNSLIHPTCLVRSLVLWRFLRTRGIESSLRIGVRMREKKMEAHAWVEGGGRVLNDSPEIGKQYAAFDRAILPRGVTLR
jgi:hypothetical protein